jgi:hypothetical protein
MIVGFIALATANLSGGSWVAAWILLGLAIIGSVGLLLTRDRIPPSHASGQEVFWHPHGWKPRQVEIVRVEPGEPEYAIVRLDTGEIKSALTADLHVPYLTRLKYS